MNAHFTPNETVITAYKDAPARTVTAGGVTYAYRELGSKGGVPVVFFVHLAANLEQMPPAGAVDPTAVVADGAEVSESVVGAEARVEPGARVTRSVLLPGATVGSRATVADCVVGPGRAVPSGELREGGIVW